MKEPPVGGTTLEWQAASQFGPYLLKRLLGRGGFGLVYEAFDTNKSRTVALKLLPQSCSTNPVFRTRLFREASTAGRLTDPHVVPIHDYGEIEGQLFIDMRLVRGTDLRTVLDEKGPLSPARAVSVVGQIASALDAAHAEQIAHRDVKPANILLTEGDFACLADFGLANAATDAKLTTTGSTVGTFAYMAPERLADEHTDHRVDVYALACVLYECLTGGPPYTASELAALIAAHLTTAIPRPSQQRPGIPAAFDDVIARGMAKNPDKRYSSAGELAAAARRALGHHHDTFPAIHPAAAAPTSRPRRIAWLAAAAVFVLVAATALTYWIGHRHDHPATPVADASAPTASPSAAVARVTATIPVGKRPEGVAVDPTNGTVYAANYGDGTLSVIDAASRTVTATIEVGKGPVWLAVDPTTHLAYTANNRDDSVSVIDTASGTLATTIPVGTNPWGLAVDPTTHTGFVANSWDNNVSVFDLAHNTVVATVPVGKNPFGVAVDPTGHTAYVANSDNTVSLINTTDHTIAAAIPVGGDPRGLAVDSAAHTVYVANESDGTVSVIDLASHAVIATIPVGKHPHGVALDSGAHLAYVANETEGTVSVIDTVKHTVVATITIGKDTFVVAVDPASHTAYTGNHDDTVSVIEPTT
ncbi:protein kinase [Mycobacterium sp. pUA109]|uniref:protein kinase domain-containing protein n=1 Tax=Mycobacterium sp. pUA109 TaxID=3238982 RepID=UPI00351BADF8